jgi:hypothetical protein
MNAKVEYLHDAIKCNPFRSSHFAWIDFNVSHIFTNIELCQEKLRILSKSPLCDTFIAFPGCWPKLTVNEKGDINENIFSDIHWRFCGGFFMGDMASILHMYNLYILYFPPFIFKYRTLVWEVNFWAWLEAQTHNSKAWNPMWFPGDHNDTIINIPIELYATNLGDIVGVKKTEYTYPIIEKFVPGSAAYLYLPSSNTHLLNTRYVNYTLTDMGYYIINHPEKIIVTKNICSELSNTHIPQPQTFREMANPPNDILPSKECKFYGLEDIRLYEVGARARFVATSINYSNTHTNRIIVGDYNTTSYSLENCKIINPPNSSGECEKNWIPIVKNGEELFIYKWFPMQIGRVDNDTLVIFQTYNIASSIFKSARGSSIFVEHKDAYIVVLHFSRESTPRHYYHFLVMLDKETLRPVKYSRVFYFEKIGIEFCIGFNINNCDNGDCVYQFWVSNFDRDPCLVTVPIKSIPFIFNIYQD